MTDHKDFERRVRVRNLALADYDAIVELQRLCFPKMKPRLRGRFESMLEKFPEGQFGVELDGKLVASSSSLIVEFALYSDRHDWMYLSGDGYIRNHDPKGGTL
jgi:hypothetical protein